MSRLYFHSPTGTAELHGSEYGWLRHLAQGPAAAAWDLDGVNDFERAVEILAMIPEPPPDQEGANYLHRYLREAQAQDRTNKAVYATWRPGQPFDGPTTHEPLHRLVSTLKTKLRVDGLDLTIAGIRLRTANLDLNTALAAGSDPIRLAAKLAGWGESHCWFDGPHRAWLADIIDEGLQAGMYRRGLWYADQSDGPKDKWSSQGWEELVSFLRTRDDEPVVTSYSVGSSFPNASIAGVLPPLPNGLADNDWDAYDQLPADTRAAHDAAVEAADERWDTLTPAERWQLAMAGLQRRRPWAQITPDNLAASTFHYPVTVWDLFAPDRDDRVRAAVVAVDGEKEPA